MDPEAGLAVGGGRDVHAVGKVGGGEAVAGEVAEVLVAVGVRIAAGGSKITFFKKRGFFCFGRFTTPLGPGCGC